MSAALLTKRQAILPGSLQLSPKRRCKIRHFCLQISGICTCKKHGEYTIKNEKRKKTTKDFYACVSGTRDNPVIEEFETR